MSLRALPILALIVSALLILVLALTNETVVTLKVFGTGIILPEGLLIGASYMFGMVSIAPLLYIRIALHQTSQQRLGQWQQQDAKLAQQVQSDKEKQLEAKIATLEAALQRAIKKN